MDTITSVRHGRAGTRKTEWLTRIVECMATTICTLPAAPCFRQPPNVGKWGVPRRAANRIVIDMPGSFFHIIGDMQISLWGLSPRERLTRQLLQVTGGRPIDDLRGLPEGGSVLIVQSGYVTEVRTFQRLITRADTVLRCPTDGRFVAAFVSAENVGTADALLRGDLAVVPEPLHVIEPSNLDVFDKSLRRSAPPLLEPVSAQARNRLEDLLYGNAYKGITDLVTKFVWPRPAKKVVRWCANLGTTPNMVTSTGFVLMVLASLLFLQGHYALGLVAGWIMTFLDTVDGKLARVTVQSSRFGHFFDHGIDLLHPPFWYIFWGMSLTDFDTMLGLHQADFYWMIVVGYIGGRLCEALFHTLGTCSIFGWRPFDAYFRLFTARRNTCMILLTLSVVVGRPDWGFVGAALWTAFTTAVLIVRLTHGAIVRARTGPLQSWLDDSEKASRDHPEAYGLFSVTRGAYARS